MQRSQLATLVVVLAALALAGCSRVQSDWKAAQSSDSEAAYQEFLVQHPDSEFSPQAQDRLKQLAEDRDWQQASTANTLDAYEQFVAQHADGKWAQEARVRIENLNLQSSEASGAPAAPTAGTAATSAAPAGASTAPKAAPPAVPAAVKSAKVPAGVKTQSAGTHSSGGSWVAQLGAYSSKARAQAAWQQLSRKFPDQLHALKPGYHSTGQGAKTVYRLQVAAGNEQKARALCARLKAKSQACLPLHG